MTTGALIFAFNNEQTDYIAMAGWSADNIHRHLDLPVAVVTNDPELAARNGRFDRIIAAEVRTGGTRWFEDYQSSVTWHNAGRVDAYSLSPWQRTLVLDADYVVASNQLLASVQCKQDFLCYRTAVSVTDDLPGLNQFGRHNFPMWWATVMIFDRCNHVQFIFDSMNMIRNNWQHYRDLYAIDRDTYRNDFALSIALGIVSGHSLDIESLPGSMITVMPNQRLEQTGQDQYKVTYQDQASRTQFVDVAGLDFHAMGKRDLGEIVENNRRTRLLDSGHKHT